MRLQNDDVISYLGNFIIRLIKCGVTRDLKVYKKQPSLKNGVTMQPSEMQSFVGIILAISLIFFKVDSIITSYSVQR